MLPTLCCGDGGRKDSCVMVEGAVVMVGGETRVLW